MTEFNREKKMCRNCIYFNLCLKNLEDELEGFKYKDEILISASNREDGRCEFFKEKTKFIELPCKVGDTVYLVDFEYGIYKCIVNDIQILSDNEPVYTLYFYSQNGYEPAELEWDIDIEIDCFGKTVFLTKEQAEAKLKEFNENENA